MERKQIKEAAALKYNENEAAPRIIALGKGEIAEKLIEKARESDVPVYENPELAHTLNMLKIGQEIPTELYEVVAEILVFVSKLDRLKGEKT